MIRSRLAARATALAGAFTVTFTALAFVSPAARAAEAQTKIIQTSLASGFSPKAIEVTTGTTIVWQNTEKMDYPVVRGAHTVTASDGTFDSGEIAPGTSFSKSFLAPGSISYVCKLHPQLLEGTITVTGPAITPPSNEKDINIVEPANSRDWGYDPKDVTGVTGLKLTWRNNGQQPHSVTADGAFDHMIEPGETWTRTFTEAVSLSYYCSLHPQMKGTIRVGRDGDALPPPPSSNDGTAAHSSGSATAPQQTARPSSGPATWRVNIVEAADTNAWGYLPVRLTARAGDTVVWTNTGAAPHTVTATDHGFDSGMIAAAASYTLHPADTGTFAYFCTVHPWMKATLIVVPAGADVDGTQVLGEKLSSSVLQPPSGPGPGVLGPDSAAGGGAEASAGRMKLALSVVAALLIFAVAAVWPVAYDKRRPRLWPARAPLADELTEIPHPAPS